MIKYSFFLSAWFILVTGYLYAGDLRVLQEKRIEIIFEPSLESAAREVANIYPKTKVGLESIFGWELNSRPSVLLIKDKQLFRSMAESPLTVAFAVPEKNLIVMDHSRINIDPFSLEMILKHELCHLLLHHHIGGGILPRWLDEGVCQWASDGIGDIILDQKRSRLNKAALRGKFINLSSLKKGFPADKELLILAYEESKSFVAHISGRFGKEGLLEVLGHMKNGEHVEAAIFKSLLVPLDKLEKGWHDSLKLKVTWFVYLSYYLYEILFAFMALITVFAFIKIILKKKAYMNDESEDKVSVLFHADKKH